MEELKCDICGKRITPENIGFAKNSSDGERIIKCNDCHDPDKNRKESSYRLLD